MKHITRSGVRDAIEFSGKIECAELWDGAEGFYADMLEEKGGTNLVKTNAALQVDLLLAAKERKLSKELFLKVVVEWKFVKGKPRHPLKKLLNSNTQADLNNAWNNAMVAMEELHEEETTDDDTRNRRICVKALNALCVLSGVGVATATAFLSFVFPTEFVFMDDEVIECLIPKKRAYTLSVYQAIDKQCRSIANGLGAAWTPSRVGRVLWTVARLSASGKLDTLLIEPTDQVTNENDDAAVTQSATKSKRLHEGSSRSNGDRARQSKRLRSKN